MDHESVQPGVCKKNLRCRARGWIALFDSFNLLAQPHKPNPIYPCQNPTTRRGTERHQLASTGMGTADGRAQSFGMEPAHLEQRMAHRGLPVSSPWKPALCWL